MMIKLMPMPALFLLIMNPPIGHMIRYAKLIIGTRFFDHQPDLNYDNPQVQKAMLKVVEFWIDQGADGIRVDAPPYLYEREGTSCENLPETHAYFKRLRAFVEAYAPETMLLAEANQWPEDVRAYFGDGDEFHMNFHFPIMPRIFMALARADSDCIKEILERTPDLPSACQWGTFLRCHDELTLEMVTPEERQFMWELLCQRTSYAFEYGHSSAVWLRFWKIIWR